MRDGKGGGKEERRWNGGGCFTKSRPLKKGKKKRKWFCNTAANLAGKSALKRKGEG